MKYILFVGLIAFVTGCMPGLGYGVRVDANSLASGVVMPKKYYLRSELTYKYGSGDDISGDDRERREYDKYLENMLHYKGYTRVTQPTDGVMVLTVLYSRYDNSFSYQYAAPIQGVVGTDSASTSTRCRDKPYGRNGEVVCESETKFNPRYGTVGYETRTGTEFASLSGLAIRADVNGAPAWSFTVSTSDQHEMRDLVPYLVEGASDYVGRSSGVRVKGLVYTATCGMYRVYGEECPDELVKIGR